MMKKSTINYGLVLPLVLLFGTNVQAQPIDLFTFDQADAVDTVSVGGADVTNFDTSSATEPGGDNSIIGHTRDLLADAVSTSNFGGGTTSLKISPNPAPGATDGQLTFSNDAGTTGYGVIQWDGTEGITNTPGNDFGITYTGLGDFDLSAVASAIQYDVVSTDLDFPITFEVYTDETHFTKVTILTTGTGLEDIPLTDFLVGGGFGCGYDRLVHGDQGFDIAVQSVECGGDNVFGDAVLGDTVDFAHLGALQVILNFDGVAATGQLDLIISSVDTTNVPEPSITALLGFGLLGFSLTSIRNRKRS